ncbi:M56 family metallopeptidase [Bacteroidales bacterium]
MNAIINYMAESLICGAVFFLLFRLIFSKENNYSFQRVSILVSSLLATIFPLISIPVSNAVVPGYLLNPAYVISDYSSGLTTEMSGPKLMSYPVLFFGLISLFFVFKYFIELVKIFILRSRSEILFKSKSYSIYQQKEIDTPFSFGKSIFLPDSLHSNDREMIVRHELSHIKRNHTADIIFMNLLISVQWFNPFIYILKSKLIEIHEFQADMDVLNYGADISEYRELIFLSQFTSAPDISNSLHKSLTFKRFIKMENLKQSKVGARLIALFSVATLLLFSVTSFSQADIIIQENDALVNDPVTSTVVLPKDTIKTVPFTVVEVKPKFQGGDENLFTKWVASNLVYPELAVKDSIQGRVIVQFDVSDKGKVENVKVVRGVFSLLDEEAHRVVSLSPDWEPGLQDGKPVRVRYTFPVIFLLSPKKK